ncbi:hypothetical protein QAO71_17270 (plasmid) [Halopseudomonas sp. SMJS2]|uniref:hypothetical protein n=1 Tax=Halopseudomonas sp. SMJS2 TaxID=3041098 RepID=UPI00245330B9|nr:hypothetical protein [Halopseudomonas sp. SMJS2]WGK63519.1 hypothetical protein QAO71_17270 [Halopseudomonas sp. SMJS2]
MSEEKKPTAIGELISKMTSGIDKVKAGNKPPKPESTTEDEIVVAEPVNEHDSEYDMSSKQQDKVVPGFENDDDPLIGEYDKAPPARPTLKESIAKMTMKQKGAAAAIVIVAVFALKNHFSGAPSSPGETAGMTETPAYIEDELELPSPTLSEAEQPLPGFEIDDPIFSGMSAAEGEPMAVQETDAPFPSFDANMPLPLTDSDLPTDSPFAAGPSPATTVEATFNAAAGAQESSFDNTSSFDTAFGGTDKPNPDSSNSDLEPGVNKELAAAQEALEKNNARVAELEQKLKEANKKLKLEQARPRGTAVAAAPRPKAPAPRPTATKQSPVANAPAPRPSLCVAAVAQAARNCSTCVAHAFLTHKGQETMLGHGDFIEGYRVSISGDRLDLQTTNGEVVHKYWSSPDGCSRT